ncbi:hypothetical protein [Solidesulfovibrio sp.]|uniref:hypothetical protein n=1 Tax=Solidesulfovibrio sp. TaxID=2910990 RepID=UPI0026211BC9|nr:hypothetical protein [Solidesulfovibrio sp.]
MLPSVLVLSPRSGGREFLTRALGNQYVVLAAASRDEALRLAHEQPECRLAFCETGRDAPGGLAMAQALKEACPRLCVVALVRPPSEASRHSAGHGLPCPVRTLPMTVAAVREETRRLLKPAPAPAPKASSGILTREEIDFLLGRDDAFGDAACQPAH